LGEPLAHEGAVYALLVVPPSAADQREPADRSPPRLFSAAADRLIKAWDLNTTDQLATLSGHQSFVCALQASRGLLYSASCDQTLAVWRLSTYERLRVFSGHRGGLYSLTIDADGRACSGSLDATVKVWPQVHDTTASGSPRFERRLLT
jgi:WD40 repeat protein